MSNLEKKLKQPFPAKEIKWRVQTYGKSNKGHWAMVLAYIDARAVMDRLEKVVGFSNWQDNIKSLDNGKTFCELSIKVNDEWITRTGVAGETNVEKEKGGASDALKRAGVKFGIGRYLYHLTTNFAETSEDKKKGDNWHKTKTKNNEYFWWKEPQLPSWALPDKEVDLLEIRKNELSKIAKNMKVKGQKVKDEIMDLLKQRGIDDIEKPDEQEWETIIEQLKENLEG